ncbi:hypothetical protein P3T32_001935, partial [Ralstonia sp. GP73]|nr:hypothetical protein [Ralstonia sp. GP73]
MTAEQLAAISLASSKAAGPYTFLGTSFSLRIKKIGPVAPGAAVEAGLLGYANINNEFNAFIVRTSTKASVTAQSCKTPDVIVQMGDRNRVGQFKGVGTSLAPVNFSINLNECRKHPVNPSCQLGGAGRPAMREQFGDVGRLVGR